MLIRRVLTVVAAGVMTVGLGLVAGCHSPKGGLMPYTGGSTTHFSYETRPLSIRMIDLRSGESFFEMDVPTGKQLTYQFFAEEGSDPVYTPTLMRYMVFDLGKQTGKLKNAMSVPPMRSIRVDVEYRDGVEFREAPPSEADRVDEASGPSAWFSTKEREPMSARDAGRTNYDN